MSQMMEVLSRPEAMLACAGALVMLMMLAAIMLRMSRRDREHESQLSELRQSLDEQLTGVRAQTEAQLRMTDEGLRRSVEQLSDGVARALSDSERGQSGRMDEYAERVSRTAQAEGERSRAFDQDMCRRMDELGARMEQEHADSVRRMAALRDDVARATAREVNARLDAALGGLSAQLKRLSGEMARLSDAASELEALRAALEERPQPVMQGAQLDALLMQWLSPGRYVRRFEVGTGSGRYADFAILMPEESGQLLYLPVDASFPAEEYADAWHTEDRRRLGEAVTAYARRMAEELIKPGLTTDFALMLITSELVSARVSELEDVMQSVQQTRRVIPVGPSAFWAMVRAMEGGMNALAMQRRSAEVERLLDEVRQELGRFTRALASPAAQERVVADGAHADGGASRGEGVTCSVAQGQAAAEVARVDGNEHDGEGTPYSHTQEQVATADAHVDSKIHHDESAPHSPAYRQDEMNNSNVDGGDARDEDAPHSPAQEQAPTNGTHVNDEASRDGGAHHDGGIPSARAQAATGGKAVSAGDGQADVNAAIPRGEEASAASWRGQTHPAGRAADEVARAARGDGELDIWS